jgi:hypothetical protein
VQFTVTYDLDGDTRRMRCRARLTARRPRALGKRPEAWRARARSTMRRARGASIAPVASRPGRSRFDTGRTHAHQFMNRAGSQPACNWFSAAAVADPATLVTTCRPLGAPTTSCRRTNY